MVGVGHGLCSSILFFMVGEVYNIHGTRNIIVKGGLGPQFSLWMIFWACALAIKRNFPPSIKFFGEVLVFYRNLLINF